MNLHYRIVILLTLTSIYVLPHTTDSQKKYIAFDLNVVFKENTKNLMKLIGYGELASYTLTHWKNPANRCLDTLTAISKYEKQKPHVSIMFKKKIMPRCIVELQEGKKNCLQTKEELTQCIEQLARENFFSSTKEKNLMISIINVIFDPKVMTTVIEPIKATVQLVQKLKAAGHSPYLIGNAPDDLYQMVKNAHPDIIKLFNGITISSQIKIVKPNAAIFQYMINSYNINPCNFILIDDLEETTNTARTMGINTIMFDKIANVTHKLRKHGITF